MSAPAEKVRTKSRRLSPFAESRMQELPLDVPPEFRRRRSLARDFAGYDDCLVQPIDMRALILSGALAADEVLTPIEQAIDVALSGRGWDVNRIHLRDLQIAYCQGCFDCWVKTPGVCKTKDAARDVTRAIVRSDLLVLLTPLTFGGYSSELKKALDRSIGIVSPFFTRIGGEVHHKQRYAKYPALLGIGVAADESPEEQRIFTTLVARNAINFHAPAFLAGIVRRDAPPDQTRSEIGRLIADITARKSGAA